MSDRLRSTDLIDLVVDQGTFTATDDDVVSDDPLQFVDTKAYAQRLQAAADASGATESITTGRARVGGCDVVLIVGEFDFLAGTLGVATAERVVRAFERAVESRVPVVALPISGGTRMQEGAAAFIQMASCAAAVQRLRDAGLLYVAYLRNPTTGGVLASWASLAHVRWAEPGALIGLTGPRVAEQMTGAPFPEGVQVAENLAVHGVIDEVVEPAALRSRLAALLNLAASPRAAWRAGAPATYVDEDASVDAWKAVTASRDPHRPGVSELLDACGAAPAAILRGDKAGTDDPGCMVSLARVCGYSAIVVAQSRAQGERGASMTAAGYRKARRGIELAGRLRLPLVTIVDTAGAAMTPRDEEEGVAASIAECLAALSAVSSPTLAVLLGEGAGGGAIALLPADRLVAAEHAWLSPIAPEGASAILYRTTERAADVAASQHITSTDLRRLGIADVVVPGAPDVLAAVIAEQLRGLADQPKAARLWARRRRYRTIARS